MHCERESNFTVPVKRGTQDIVHFLRKNTICGVYQQFMHNPM